jgi:3-phosphoshikimate 1-carboxyvinyltransferase
MTNRALICAALAHGESTLRDPCESEDTKAMRDCLHIMGVETNDANAAIWRIRGNGGQFSALSYGDAAMLHVRGSGTTARFLAAASLLSDIPVCIDGNARMRERPMKELIDVLKAAGAGVCAYAPGYDEEPLGLPFRIEPRNPKRYKGGELVVDASRSSQFLSAFLMIGPVLHKPLRVIAKDRIVVSETYLDTTIEIMRTFGASISPTIGDEGPRAFDILPTSYLAARMEIEADASACAYLYGGAALTGGTAEMLQMPTKSTQADVGLLRVFEKMGCRVERLPDSVNFGGFARKPFDEDFSRMPDGALAMAVIAAFADGASVLRGLSTLRFKESDRLTALATELNRLGAPAHIEGDTLRVEGKRLEAWPKRPPGTETRILTYDDHRMAMSFAMAGLVLPGILIENPDCTEKTWPGFFEAFDRLSYSGRL